MDLLQRQTWSYLTDLPPNIDAMRELLEGYSQIPAEEIDRHLHKVVWSLVQPPLMPLGG